MNDLIAIIEGAAPTIASALVPGPLSGPVGSLAGLAIAHLAEGLGLPHPAEPADIINALSNLASPSIKDAVLSRAEANFQTTIAPVIPAAPEAATPVLAPIPAEPGVSTHHGVTMDMPTMIVFMMLSTLSGWLASRGISLQGFEQALTGSTDLQVAAAMLAGTITMAWRYVRGTNLNTAALASSGKV
jgi:hypothetical protein